MLNLDKYFCDVSDKYIAQAADLLDTVIPEEKIQPLIKILQDAIAEGMTVAEDKTREAITFKYQIAEQTAKVDIKEANQDGPQKHYFWAMRAGFGDEAEAKAYYHSLQNREPGKRYGVFIDGIPAVYDD